MNIFELCRLMGPLTLAFLGFHWVEPFGLWLALLAGLVGMIVGWFVGPWFGLLFLLPFEGAARLSRFVRHGRWTD
jgi:hypothetical protein